MYVHVDIILAVPSQNHQLSKSFVVFALLVAQTSFVVHLSSLQTKILFKNLYVYVF